MKKHCSICGTSAKHRFVLARSGKEILLWHCKQCCYDFQDHDPGKDLAANLLDGSRLKSAGLDIPTVEIDFENGLAQSRSYIKEYLEECDRNANILEIGCSWGYFLQLSRDFGSYPYGVELNAIRAGYVNERLCIPCDESLQQCELRGLKFRKIFMFYVLEYIYEPLSFVQRLINMLEVGGTLIVITPNLNDAIKDLWQNSQFQKFFYDEHAINYMTVLTVENLVARLSKEYVRIDTRQGYSFLNHLNWFLNQSPRTTGVVGGDNLLSDVLFVLQPLDTSPEWSIQRRDLAFRLGELIQQFDIEYRRTLEDALYGNQIRFQVKR